LESQPTIGPKGDYIVTNKYIKFISIRAHLEISKIYMLIKKITFKNENKWTYESKTKISPFESPLLNFGEHFQG
jgi:hypothetical protein